jgi:hypothetical protein
VRFEDIDRVEIDLALVLVGEFVEGGNLPPKWRSGIAPEHKHYGAFRPERTKVNGSRLVQVHHRQRGSDVTHFDMPMAGRTPKRFKR